jgi:hypothetical protein
MARRMARRALKVPHLAAWVSTLRPGTAPQYASCVRSFFRHCPSDKPEDITRDDLIAYCVAIDASAMRSKTTSALDAYFSYLEENGHIKRHPAHNLARSVSAARNRLALISDLTRRGVSDRQAATLQWRHVAKDMVTPRHGLPRNIDDQLRARLVNSLLDRLRSASAETVDDLLARSLIEP